MTHESVLSPERRVDQLVVRVLQGHRHDGDVRGRGRPPTWCERPWPHKGTRASPWRPETPRSRWCGPWETSIDVPWEQVTVFHLDEYIDIDDDHPASFRRWIRERIEHPLNQSKCTTSRVTPATIEDECRRYEGLLRAAPLDLICLGIGENGHIAFNDPGADLEDPAWVRAIELDDMSTTAAGQRGPLPQRGRDGPPRYHPHCASAPRGRAAPRRRPEAPQGRGGAVCAHPARLVRMSGDGAAHARRRSALPGPRGSRPDRRLNDLGPGAWDLPGVSPVGADLRTERRADPVGAQALVPLGRRHRPAPPGLPPLLRRPRRARRRRRHGSSARTLRCETTTWRAGSWTSKVGRRRPCFRPSGARPPGRDFRTSARRPRAPASAMAGRTRSRSLRLGIGGDLGREVPDPRVPEPLEDGLGVLRRVDTRWQRQARQLVLEDELSR